MNTRQKLTLGIAAIFMVTLTIVGVTYAYFVTRVDGDITESVNVSTATLGDVTYVAGNGTGDLVELKNVIPGNAVYKSFSVKNTNTTTLANGGALSYYNIITSNTATAYTEQFIHSADGKNATITAACYGYTGGTFDDTTDYTRATQPLKYSETTGDDNATVRSTCFSSTTGAKYNNIRYTLWEVDSAITTEITADPNGTKLVDRVQTAYNATNEVLYDGANDTGITIAPGNGAEGTIGNDDKDTNSIRHYVLKVEYLDTADETADTDPINGAVTGDENQNAENEAGIDITISIEAA